jgi:hypothetical protein
MPIFRTRDQKDNLAKFFWDMAKIAFAFFLVAPIAQSQRTDSYA